MRCFVITCNDSIPHPKLIDKANANICRHFLIGYPKLSYRIVDVSFSCVTHPWWIYIEYSN